MDYNNVWLSVIMTYIVRSVNSELDDGPLRPWSGLNGVTPLWFNYCNRITV